MAVGHRNRGEAAVGPAGAHAIARAVRPELDGAAVRVEPHEAARARTHRVHRDERQRKNEARHVRVRSNREVALRDERHVERRAADIRARDVVVAERLAQQLRADHAANRPRNDRARKLLRLPADRAAVRGHHSQVELRAVLLEAVADLLERLPRRLGRVGFEHRRVHAVAFLALRVVVHRGEHRHVRTNRLQFVAHDVACLPLARRVLVRLQEADHDGLRAGCRQFARGLPDLASRSGITTSPCTSVRSVTPRVRASGTSGSS